MAFTDYLRDPRAWLAALGTGAGAYSAWRQQQAMNEYLRAYGQHAARVMDYARTPVDPNRVFAPMQEQLTRNLEAGLAARGVMPGGGAHARALGEGLAPFWLTAHRRAQAERDSTLRAMLGLPPVKPGAVPVGSLDALGKYLAVRQQEQAAREARQRQTTMNERFLAMMEKYAPSPGFPGGSFYPPGTAGGGASAPTYSEPWWE